MPPATPDRHTRPDEEVHIRALILSLLAIATLAASIFTGLRTRSADRRRNAHEAGKAGHAPFSLDALRNAGL